MPDWVSVLDLVALVALALAIVAVVLFFRRRWLSRRGGTFDLCVRVRSVRAGRGWVLGLGRYQDDYLEWFRSFSLWMRPKQSFYRPELEIRGRRRPEGREASVLYADAIIVDCMMNGSPVQLALSENALTGLLSWLESAPPGHDLPD